MNEVMNTIMHRRAIRRFSEKQIEENVLQNILKAGLCAPSAGGRQGVIFVVCQDGAINEKLGKIKRANSSPHMAIAASYVSREQPSIADDPKLINYYTDWRSIGHIGAGINVNRYMDAPKHTYQKFFELVKDKDYFVLTTNVDFM